MNKLQISPSILSADFAIMWDELQELENAGADMVHVDVMDGHFVPNLTFGAPVIKKWRDCTKLNFDVHLMIAEPAKYIEDFVKAGADIITIHHEAVEDVPAVLAQIKKHGVKCGVSLKPATSADVLKDYIDQLDMVLVMTVEPGFGGQNFMPEQLEKVKKIRQILDANKSSAYLSVDGGVNVKNAKQIKAVGADVLVAGSAIFMGDYAKNIQDLRKA